MYIYVQTHTLTFTTLSIHLFIYYVYFAIKIENFVKIITPPIFCISFTAINDNYTAIVKKKWMIINNHYKIIDNLRYFER